MCPEPFRSILAGDAVAKAMAQAFETTTGELAERLMSALEAGQAAGGDARGMQAGGILVVKPIDDPSRTTDRWWIFAWTMRRTRSRSCGGC